MKFTEFLGDLKLEKMEGFKHVDPSTFTGLNEAGQKRFLTANNGVFNYVHNECLELDKKLSQKLYEAYPDLWEKIINDRHNQSDGIVFSTNYITYANKMLIDVFRPESTSSFESILNKVIQNIKYNELLLETSYNSGGDIITKVTNLVETTAVLIITCNLNKSYYSIHDGFLDSDGCLRLFPKPLTETYDIVEFIESINDIDLVAKMESTSAIIDGCETQDINNVLSYRELLDFIKSAKLNLVEDEEGFVEKIEDIISNDNKEIVNSLVESLRAYPYKSLKRMNFLKKSLKNTGITVKDLLILFSDNLLNSYLNISPALLSKIYSVAINCDSDEVIKRIAIKEKDI